MQTNTIIIELSLEKVDNDIIANLLFYNNGTDTIYLDKWTTCIYKKFLNDVFNIYDEQGKRMSYVGPMARRDIGPGDFIALNPREKVKTSIAVNNGYRLVQPNKYIVQYSAVNPSYLGKQHLMGLQSNKVEILYQ